MIHLVFVCAENEARSLLPITKKYCELYYGKVATYECLLPVSFGKLVATIDMVAASVGAGEEVWVYWSVPLKRYNTPIGIHHAFATEEKMFSFEWLYHWLVHLRISALADKVVCILDTNVMVEDRKETRGVESPWPRAELYLDCSAYRLNGIALPFDGLIMLAWVQFNVPKPQLCGISMMVNALRTIFARMEPQSWTTIRSDIEYLCDLFMKDKAVHDSFMLFANGMQDYLQLGSNKPFMWAANQYRIASSEPKSDTFVLDVGLGIGHDFSYTYLVADGQIGLPFPLSENIKTRFAKPVIPLTPFRSILRVLSIEDNVPDRTYQVMHKITKHQGDKHAWHSLLSPTPVRQALPHTAVLLRPPIDYHIGVRIDNELDVGLQEARKTLLSHLSDVDCFFNTENPWYTIEIRRNKIEWHPTWPEKWQQYADKLTADTARNLYDEVYQQMECATHIDRWFYLFLAACLRLRLLNSPPNSYFMFEQALSYCRLAIVEEESADDELRNNTAVELFYVLHRDQEFYVAAPAYLPGTIRQDPRTAFDSVYTQATVPCRIELLYAACHLHYWSVMKLYQLTVARNYYWEYAKSHLRVKVGEQLSLRADGRVTMAAADMPEIDMHSYDGKIKKYRMHAIRFNSMSTIDSNGGCHVFCDDETRCVAKVDAKLQSNMSQWMSVVLVFIPERSQLPKLAGLQQGNVCHSRSTLANEKVDVMSDHYYPEYEIFHVKVQ